VGQKVKINKNKSHWHSVVSACSFRFLLAPMDASAFMDPGSSVGAFEVGPAASELFDLALNGYKRTLTVSWLSHEHDDCSTSASNIPKSEKRSYGVMYLSSN